MSGTSIQAIRIALCLLFAPTALCHGAEKPTRSPREWVRYGMEEFRQGRVEESLRAFESAARDQPDLRPHLWQLGISYYYQGEYLKGRKLFEAHQKVNAQDVENAVWHFLCVARLDGIKTAREQFIPITEDSRIPMSQVHQLFAGKGSEEEVLKAAQAGHPSSAELKDRMFYAALYLALFEEASGHPEESLKWIRQAVNEYGQSHYMGAVARVHLSRREKASPQ